MSEQNANSRYENGRRFRLYEIILGIVLTALFTLMSVMLGVLISSGNRTADQVAALDRKLDEKVAELNRKVDEKVAELNRKVDENTRILVRMQTTLDLIASGLDISVKPKEPKEQAGPAADAPAPSEQLATKDP